MALLLDYLPLESEFDEYESGPVPIQASATLVYSANALPVGHITLVGRANLFVQGFITSFAEVNIVGAALLKINSDMIIPVISIANPKMADIKSYIIRRHHEVEVSSGSANVEIETRHPDIKVIDID